MDDRRYRGVYGYFINNMVVYTGSSALAIDALDQNHRNWKTKYGEQGRTNFRTHITEHIEYAGGEFRWLIKPELRTQREVEELEGQLIRSLNPILNIDRDPVGSSIKHGRYHV